MVALKRRLVSILVIVFVSVSLSLLPGCEPKRNAGSQDLGVGPDLLLEEETVALVRRETPLVEVTTTGLQTCGPVFRFVTGKTADDREIVVWAAKEIVGQVYLDEVTTQEQAIYATQELWSGCTVHDAVPVYIPDWAKADAIADIKEAPVNAFWQVIYSCGDEASKDSSFVPMLDLETALGGAVVRAALQQLLDSLPRVSLQGLTFTYLAMCFF